jgi:isopenicillin N synthase-like dioxygenase
MPSPQTLPVLDFSRLGHPATREAFLTDLRETARSLGFFYLSGHGIDAGLISEVLGLSRPFFDLPERDKLEIQMIKSPQFRGYNRGGLEHTRGKPDWREQVDIGPEQEPRPLDRSAPAWNPAGPVKASVQEYLRHHPPVPSMSSNARVPTTR